MNVFAWIVIAWFSFGTILMIATTGKERKPSTPGAVAIGTLINAAVIWLIVLAVTQ